MATSSDPVVIVSAARTPLGKFLGDLSPFSAHKLGSHVISAAVERVVAALLECGPEALRAQKALLRQWEELPLKESVDLSIGVFGQSYLTGEPQRLMLDFVNRKR